MSLLTVSEVAKQLQVHPMTVGNWIRAGKLPAVRLPGGAKAPYRIQSEDLERIRQVSGVDYSVSELIQLLLRYEQQNPHTVAQDHVLSLAEFIVRRMRGELG